MKTVPNINLEVCNLTTLSDSEVASLRKLKISEWQEVKGGSFVESVNAWEMGPIGHIFGLCFLLKNDPVGMTLFKRAPLSPSWVPDRTATIHGLKIARPWQGRGLGHIAFGLAIDFLKKEWPEIATLMLGVDADNAAALAVYRAFGMTDSGPIFEGRNGPEHRFKISL